MRKLLLYLLATPPEDDSPYRPPPFWLFWLTAYLAALPCALILPLMSFVMDGTSEPPMFGGILFLSLHLSAIPYIQLAGDRNKTIRQWDRDRARLARWRQPAQLYRTILRGTSLVAVLASLAHFMTGHVTVRQVVLVTLGLPLYYFLLVPLLTLLHRRVAQARRVKAGAASMTRAASREALPVSAYVPPAVEATETVAVGQRR